MIKYFAAVILVLLVFRLYFCNALGGAAFEHYLDTLNGSQMLWPEL